MSEPMQMSVESLIDWALTENAQREIGQYPAQTELDARYPDLSAFQKRVLTGKRKRRSRRTLERRQQSGRRGRINFRRVAVLAAIVMFFASIPVVNSDLNAYVADTMINWENRRINIQFIIKGVRPDAVSNDYGPHYIPEYMEFLPESSSRDSSGFFYAYESKEREEILDISATVANLSSSTSSEAIIYEKITFNEVTAYLGTFKESNGYVMMWVKNGITHSIYTSLSLSEVFKIAENIY